MDATLARKKRINELEELLARRNKLTDDEYLELLHEIRKNYTVSLAMLSVRCTTAGTGATINVIDKVHWLIDNIEGKDIEKPDGDDFTVNVHFMKSEDD